MTTDVCTCSDLTCQSFFFLLWSRWVNSGMNCHFQWSSVFASLFHMFHWLRTCQILFFVLFTVEATTNRSSLNRTTELPVGFFCLYCGRSDHIQSHVSMVESKQSIDCSRPYQIYCSSREAIGCLKHVKIIDYHIDVIRDCLRFAELPFFTTVDVQCKSVHSETDLPTQEKTFCCNDRHFCNQTSSVFLPTTKSLFVCFQLFLLVIYQHRYGEASTTLFGLFLLLRWYPNKIYYRIIYIQRSYKTVKRTHTCNTSNTETIEFEEEVQLNNWRHREREKMLVNDFDWSPVKALSTIWFVSVEKYSTGE